MARTRKLNSMRSYNFMMMSTLYYMLSWIFIMLAHWNNSQRIDMLLLLETLSWFWANQSMLLLLNAACLAEKQQIPILQSLAWPDHGSKPWSTRLKAKKLTITPMMPVCWQRKVKNKDINMNNTVNQMKNTECVVI